MFYIMVVILTTPYILQLFRYTLLVQVPLSAFLLFGMLFLSSCYRVFQVSALRSYDSICLYHIWCMTCIVRVTPHPLMSIYHLTTFHPTRTHLLFLYYFPYKQKTPIGSGGSPKHYRGYIYLILYPSPCPMTFTLFMSTVRKGLTGHIHNNNIKKFRIDYVSLFTSRSNDLHYKYNKELSD